MKECVVVKECRSSNCFPHAAVSFWWKWVTGLLGMEKVRLHSRELKSSQDESVEGWREEKLKGGETGWQTDSQSEEFFLVQKWLSKQCLLICEGVLMNPFQMRRVSKNFQLCFSGKFPKQMFYLVYFLLLFWLKRVLLLMTFRQNP